jgi:uncharacterized protein
VTPAPIHLAGERLMLDPAGVLVWPSAGLLAVADLHFEKGTACAVQGRLVPPWDTAATLDRLAHVLRRWQPRIVLALGDSFHDAKGAARLQSGDAARLRAMTEATRFIWVCGNHDPCAPEGIAGESVPEFTAGPFTFRHIAKAGAAHEISGHYHPKAVAPTRATSVERPCFVTDARRIILPAFGAYTGGLDVRNAALGKLFPRGGRVFLLGRDRLFSFALAEHRARQAELL